MALLALSAATAAEASDSGGQLCRSDYSSE